MDMLSKQLDIWDFRREVWVRDNLRCQNIGGISNHETGWVPQESECNRGQWRTGSCTTPILRQGQKVARETAVLDANKDSRACGVLLIGQEGWRQRMATSAPWRWLVSDLVSTVFALLGELAFCLILQRFSCGEGVENVTYFLSLVLYYWVGFLEGLTTVGIFYLLHSVLLKLPGPQR